MKKTTIWLFFSFLLLLPICTTLATTFSEYKIVKLSTITLIENNHFRLQTTYGIEPNIDVVLISADMVRATNISNIMVRFDHHELSSKYYEESVVETQNETVPLRCIMLDAPLSHFTDIHNHEGTIIVDFIYDFYLPLQSTMTNVQVIEWSLSTTPQVEVTYFLQIISEDDSQIPSIVNMDADVSVEQVDINESILNRVYNSFKVDDEEFSLKPFFGIQFWNTSTYPVLKSRRTIKFIDSKTVEETYQYMLSGKDFSDDKIHLNVFPIPKQVSTIDHPRIDFILDKKQKTITPITFEELNEIIESGNELTIPTPFYYFGKGNNLSNNTLFFGYRLPFNSTAELEYHFEYDSSNLISAKDEFNYKLSYNIINPLYLRELEEYWKFELPSEFVITNTNYKDQLVSQDVHSCAWKFEDVAEYFGENKLIIDFQRQETPTYDFLRYANIIAFSALILSLIFFYDKVKNNLLAFLMYPVIDFLLFVFAILLNSYDWLSAFTYTFTYLSLIWILIVLIAKIILKKKAKKIPKTLQYEI